MKGSHYDEDWVGGTELHAGVGGWNEQVSRWGKSWRGQNWWGPSGGRPIGRVAWVGLILMGEPPAHIYASYSYLPAPPCICHFPPTHSASQSHKLSEFSTALYAQPGQRPTSDYLIHAVFLSQHHLPSNADSYQSSIKKCTWGWPVGKTQGFNWGRRQASGSMILIVIDSIPPLMA